MGAVSIQVEHEGEAYAGTVMRIKATSLGTEDHGILTAYLHCEAKHSGVLLGGYSLDTPVKRNGTTEREGTAFGLEHLVQIMRTVGVSTWEKVAGSDVIALFEGQGGWGGRGVGIASLDGDRVLIFEKHLELWKAQHPEVVDA